MKLTPEQQAVLDGSKGEVMAKVMKTLVMYGDAFGAEKMVPVTSTYGHTVISFGINAMKPVYDLYDQLIEAGAFSEQKFTADPLPLDKNVPSNPLQDLVFHQFMYKQQARYEAQLRKLGILSDKDYTCTCYLDEVGNKPKQGEVLSWAESSAVVYANSVLGARCNRNSGMIELMGSIAGCVPYFGFLTDDGRKADWIVEVRTTKKPEPQLLGSAIGMKVMEKVPYVKGLTSGSARRSMRMPSRISRTSARPPRPTAPWACTTSSTSRPRPCSRARRSSATARPCTSSTTRSSSACARAIRACGRTSTPSRSCASWAART